MAPHTINVTAAYRQLGKNDMLTLVAVAPFDKQYH